ncbi:hypothetical protein BTO05_00360 [Winogradskyella sp. PC-19]|uniref:glycoside hydrolase family 2 TIM barrel-domain containing protein n=1 Tax=unclassified Winogradskyella TaxID=2615021 RepID=UPI000B3C123F|nr:MULTISPECIES: glycoside hydrolase family 2 TIM barrel-domain containing protein [unclassified Winogradskyella]ARV08165.1 hypothetical protein BTO05_00360 [Winogradskyella sp. PC-19]
MRYLIILLFFSSLLSSQTTVEKSQNKWLLKVDGNDFKVKGVTFGYDKDTANYDNYFKELKVLGVNTIRTWATGDNSLKLLDNAHANGIKVMMGIWMRHGRPGMEDDDSFNYLKDTKGKEAMYDNAIKVVNRYKNHPAILTWGIGNEVYLNIGTEEEKLAYSKLLERICSQIKELDPNHPVTSVEAWTFGMDWWEKHVPSIDIYGLNSYGFGANFLQEELNKRNINKPYIITEFGVTGEWDIKNEKLAVKIEPSDTEKYDAIVTGYKDWIVDKPSCLGVYVFHYSNSNNFISPWLYTHVNGYKRPQYWAIREAYTGKKPDNKVPFIKSFVLTETNAKSEIWLPVDLHVTDKDNDSLEFSFYYNHRKGSRKRRDAIKKLNHRGSLKGGFEIELPKVHGATKIYVYVNDNYGNLAIASDVIDVFDKNSKKKKYLVPKVDLPFYVYKDNNEIPYVPSGLMGNYRALNIDLNHTDNVQSGKTAIEISYNVGHDWYGVAMVDPANDWGNILGGYDISGAKSFSFWAKATSNKVLATIGFGLIDKDKPFPDTAKKSVEIILTKEWKKYTIKTKRQDLSCIRSGFVLFSSGIGQGHKIYLDNIVFE